MRKDNRYYPTSKALLTAIRNGDLPNSKIVYDTDDPDYIEIDVDRIELEQWARHTGFNWILPPFTPFKLQANNYEQSHSAELAKAQQEIEALRAENESLKAEIEQLKKEAQVSPKREKPYNSARESKHLKMIAVLVMARTDKNYTSEVYKNTKTGELNINAFTTSIFQDLSKYGLAFGISEDAFRTRLAEILKENIDI